MGLCHDEREIHPASEMFARQLLGESRQDPPLGSMNRVEARGLHPLGALIVPPVENLQASKEPPPDFSSRLEARGLYSSGYTVRVSMKK